jgi:N utilization substance protein B
MVNRRFLREKVLQNLYAYEQQTSADLYILAKNMLFGIEKLYELYARLQALLVEISVYALERAEIERQKNFYNPEIENAHIALANNLYSKKMTEDENLKFAVEKYKISWGDDPDILYKTYQNVFESKQFKDFINSEQCFDDARTFWHKYIKRRLSENDDFADFFKEQNPYWYSDFSSVMYWFQSDVKNEDAKVIKYEEFAKEEDLDFAEKLFFETVEYKSESDKLIEKNLKDWSFDRTLIVEILIMRMGITEILHFRSIPFKVSINESIELVKKFSIEEHKTYINGIFHSVVEEMLK